MTPIAAPPVADADPLDARLARAHGVPPAAGGGRLGPALTAPHTRTLILLPLGLALGPSGMNLLSSPVLAFVDPLVSVALSMLGVLLGMSLDVRRVETFLVAGAASLEVGLTITLVGAGAMALHVVWLTPDGAPWVFVVLLGLCAAASFSPSTGAGEPHSLRLAQLGDLDNVLVIVGGALVLALHRGGSLASAAVHVSGLLLVAVALAAAGWLLVAHATSERERRTFMAGTLLLLAGAAAYLGHSALFVGLAAGLVWGEAGGPAGDRIARDVRHVQHPLVVLLLLVAGARLALGPDGLALAFVYLVCRTAAKLSAAWVVARGVPSLPAPVTGAHLLAPGIVGLGFALNVLQAGGDHAPAGLLLTAVAVGSVAMDLIAVAASRRGERV
jgi:hypothetical protein